MLNKTLLMLIAQLRSDLVCRQFFAKALNCRQLIETFATSLVWQHHDTERQRPYDD